MFVKKHTRALELSEENFSTSDGRSITCKLIKISLIKKGLHAAPPTLMLQGISKIYLYAVRKSNKTDLQNLKSMILLQLLYCI